MSTPDPFAAPAQGGTLKALRGKLLLIECKRTERKKSKFPTDDGSGFKDAVICDVTVLSDDKPYTLYGIAVMSGSMTGQLLPYVGTDTPVLGTLDKSEFEKGEGWVLEEATEDDKVIAREYIANKPKPEKPKDPFAAATKA